MGIAKLVVLGICPLISIVYLNWKIYKGVKFPPSLTEEDDKRQQRRENELAKVLIGIVMVFIVCHAFRVAIEIDNMVISDTAEACYNAGKPEFSLWSLIIDPMSDFMMVLNSSINMIIYCCFNAKFRKYILPCIKASNQSFGMTVRNMTRRNTCTETAVSSMTTKV